MNTPTTDASRAIVRRGTFFCVLSAVAYTAYNACLREVSDQQDSAWINCVQASVGAAVFGAYLVWRGLRGFRVLPPWKQLVALVVIGFITQVGGVLTIWAMSVVGVGITGTLQMGVMLASSAILGQIVLGEKVSLRQMLAIAMITVAVLFFSIGAQSAGEVAPSEIDAVITAPAAAPVSADADAPSGRSSLRILLGILAGVCGGLAFGVLTVGIRKTVTSDTSPEAVVFLINAMGVVAFGPWSVYLLGLDALVATPLNHLGVMLAAGAMNLAGFFLITISLKMITVVRVNVINNALTMVLTVIVGMALFAEPLNSAIAAGILLSVVGTLLISLSTPPENDEIATCEPTVLD